MSRWISYCLVLGWMLAASPLQAAIVNTLRGFSGSEPGWSGGVSGSHGAAGGNTEETQITAAAQVQWQGQDQMVRLIGSGKRSSSKGVETARALTGHLRHNYRLGGQFSTLAFFQIQENPFQLLKSRTLLGLGGRFDAVARKDFSLALGAAHMLESERLEGMGGHESYQRLSVFVSLVKELKEGVSVDAVVFYQPLWSEFDDWRSFAKTDLKVALAGTLTIFTGIQVEHDSRPAEGVEQTDWQTTTGFSASF